MEYSFISTLVVFLFLTHNLDDCTPEPIIPVISTLNLTDIGYFLWSSHENSFEKNYLRETLLSPSQEFTHYYSRYVEPNLIQRFNYSYYTEGAVKNYRELDTLTFSIEFYYKFMKRCNESIVSNSNDCSRERMKSLATESFSHSSDKPLGLLRWLVYHLTTADSESIFSTLQRRFQGGYTHDCPNENDMESDQTLVLKFLTLIAAAQTKVFMTVQIAAEIMKNQFQGDYSFYLQLSNKEIYEKYSLIMEEYSGILKGASRGVWRCDPPSHVEGVTYIKLNNVFNKFIVNEKNLANNRGCKETCNELNPRHLDTSCNSEIGTKCPGSLWNCGSGFDIDISKKLRICHSNSNSSRRYDYVDIVWKVFDSKSVVHYGSQKNCDNGQIGYESLGYDWFDKCDICTCTSDNVKEYSKTDPRRTERFFYAKPVHADVANNYVITGVQLVKEDGIVSFKIQQGKLSILNTVEPSSISWKTVEQENLYNTSNLLKIHWLQRGIELKDVDVPAGHVLVGLQFDMIKDRIILKVISLPIDLVNGRIKRTNDISINNATYSTSPVLPETVLDLEDHHLPDPEVKSNQTVTNKYLNFSTSSMYSDVGQTTLPLLDIQNVTTTTPTPMSGAGFYFKYTGEYKGYLGIKLKTYDFSRH